MVSALSARDSRAPSESESYLGEVLARQRGKTVRKPLVAPKYLPVLVLLALVIFIEYRLCYEFVLSNQLGLSFQLSHEVTSLLADARQGWLYSAPLVVVGVFLLQHSRFVGRLIPEAIEEIDEIASRVSAGIVIVFAIVVSAIIKLVLVVAS